MNSLELRLTLKSVCWKNREVPYLKIYRQILVFRISVELRAGWTLGDKLEMPWGGSGRLCCYKRLGNKTPPCLPSEISLKSSLYGEDLFPVWQEWFSMVRLNTQFSRRYFYNYPVSVRKQFLEQWDSYCIVISVIINVLLQKMMVGSLLWFWSFYFKLLIGWKFSFPSSFHFNAALVVFVFCIKLWYVRVFVPWQNMGCLFVFLFVCSVQTVGESP